MSHKVTKLNWLLSNGQLAFLTCCNKEKTVNGIITVGWMMPTSHIPFLLLVSVGNGERNEESFRACHALIDETKEFGLNVPTPSLTEQLGKVGTTHSDELDKFKEAGLTPLKSTVIDAPMISECFLNLECKVIDQVITGDHTVFVGEPVAAFVEDDLIVDGKFSEKYFDKKNQVHMSDFIALWNLR